MYTNKKIEKYCTQHIHNLFLFVPNQIWFNWFCFVVAKDFSIYLSTMTINNKKNNVFFLTWINKRIEQRKITNFQRSIKTAIMAHYINVIVFLSISNVFNAISKRQRKKVEVVFDVRKMYQKFTEKKWQYWFLMKLFPYNIDFFYGFGLSKLCFQLEILFFVPIFVFRFR